MWMQKNGRLPLKFIIFISFFIIVFKKFFFFLRKINFGNFSIHYKAGNRPGSPEYLKYSDTEFLKRLYDDIIYRDIITSNRISGSKVLFAACPVYLYNCRQRCKAMHHSQKLLV